MCDKYKKKTNGVQGSSNIFMNRFYSHKIRFLMCIFEKAKGRDNMLPLIFMGRYDQFLLFNGQLTIRLWLVD